MTHEEIRARWHVRAWKTIGVICVIATILMIQWSWTTYWYAHEQAKRSDHAEQSVAAMRVSVDGMSGALKLEQARAGYFESGRDKNWTALMHREKQLTIVQSWFNSYRAEHGSPSVNWPQYFKKLEKEAGE